jgi:hypothetical protein
MHAHLRMQAEGQQGNDMHHQTMKLHALFAQAEGSKAMTCITKPSGCMQPDAGMHICGCRRRTARQ